MVPLTWLLRRTKAGYEWGNKGFKLNHLFFMDDLRFFVKNKNQIDSLVQTVQIFSEDTDISVEYLSWREEKLLEQMVLDCQMGNI